MAVEERRGARELGDVLLAGELARALLALLGEHARGAIDELVIGTSWRGMVSGSRE